MQNRTFANRLMWSLVDQGCFIKFEPNNGVITCVISKDKQEASAESNNVSSALYLAWRIFKEESGTEARA